MRTLVVAGAAAGLVTACTFTGLGNYDVETCSRPLGLSNQVQQVGVIGVGDVTISGSSGKNVIGAFIANVTGGTCIEAVTVESKLLSQNCSFLSDELSRVPHQPMVAPLNVGYAAAFIATTSPCTRGALTYRDTAPGIAGKAEVPCTTGAALLGAALPSIAPIGDGATAVVAWYRTTFDSRSDPISACAEAKAASLDVAIVQGASTGTPALGAAVTLSMDSTSIRPAAIAPVPGQSQVVIAAPLADDVGIWSVDATTGPSQPVKIPSLSGARAVAIAIASDGSGQVAVAAEIGCSPKSILLAVGSLGGGFSNATVVAPPGNDLAVAPSVAWIDGQNRWVVAWISSKGGAHVLAQSFDRRGNALGPAADPGLKATTAAVSSTADVLGFVNSSMSFVDTSLGCAP